MSSFRPVSQLWQQQQKYVFSGRQKVFSQLLKKQQQEHCGTNYAKQTRHVHRQIRRQPQRSKLTPVENVDAAQPPVRSPGTLLRPFLFTCTATGASFVGCAIWQYEELRNRANHALGKFQNKRDEFSSRLGSFRHHAHMWWHSKTKGQKLMVGIVGLNVLVFGAWKIPALQASMLKWFCSSPFGGAPSWSMLLSTFSHARGVHIFVNMYVLWSFSVPILTLLGKEQFLAFYLTAGVVSSFTSYIMKVARVTLVPSIGASGAIMAIIGAVCSHYPDARLSIAFVDQIIPHSFSSGTAVKCLIGFDALGLLLGWRLFDHAAHLGGILFGLWYVNYGHKLIWGKREPVMRLWHQIRSKT